MTASHCCLTEKWWLLSGTRVFDEPGKASIIDGADSRCWEGTVQSAEGQAWHTQVRSHLPCLSCWTGKSQEQRKGELLFLSLFCNTLDMLQRFVSSGTQLKANEEEKMVVWPLWCYLTIRHYLWGYFFYSPQQFLILWFPLPLWEHFHFISTCLYVGFCAGRRRHCFQ